MNIPDELGPDEALKLLRPITPLIYAGIEAGTLEVREFFEAREKPIDDVALAAHLLRWRAKHHIRQVMPGLAIELEMEPLANSGLSLFYEGRHVRIRKAIDGGYDKDGDRIVLAPIPGPSSKLQEFYAQQLSLLGFEDRSDIVLNLLLLWEVTSDFRLTGLTLACPRSGGITRASVKMWWQSPIAHPALSLEAAASSVEADDDLPFKIDEDEDATGTPNS